MAVLSETGFRLRCALEQTLCDEFCARLSYRFDGEEYELGESDPGEPFILIRKSDGKCFEIELEANIYERIG